MPFLGLSHTRQHHLLLQQLLGRQLLHGTQLHSPQLYQPPHLPEVALPPEELHLILVYLRLQLRSPRRRRLHPKPPPQALLLLVELLSMANAVVLAGLVLLPVLQAPAQWLTLTTRNALLERFKTCPEYVFLIS